LKEEFFRQYNELLEELRKFGYRPQQKPKQAE